MRRFVEKEIAPNVDEWEEAREFPRELYGRCAELGFLGLKFPEEYGGQGGTHLHDAIWVEELARSGGSAESPPGSTPTPRSRCRRSSTSAPTSRSSAGWCRGSPARRSARWASPSRAPAPTSPGSPPSPSGSASGYVVNGSKTFITNGVRADFLVCACKTTKEGGHGGISFLVLEREMPGYEVAAKLEKLGWHSSDTGELSFTDVEVPAENLLGEENEGFKLIMFNFAWERLLMAIGAVGAMQRLIETTVEYAKERRAFGRPIGNFQVIRHKVAEMATQAEAAKAITYNALRLFHEGHDCIREVTMAKLVTQRGVLEIADECLQIHGGYGYMREYGIERAVRDARLGPIGGGTDEIMKEILGKQLGL